MPQGGQHPDRRRDGAADQLLRQVHPEPREYEHAHTRTHTTHAHTHANKLVVRCPFREEHLAVC